MARGSVIIRLVRFWYSAHAGKGSATQTGRPSTRNLMSTASAWRVATATISAWYRQWTCFLVQRSVAWKSLYMRRKTIPTWQSGGKSRGRQGGLGRMDAGMPAAEKAFLATA